MYVMVLYAILVCFLLGIVLSGKKNTRRLEMVISGIVFLIILMDFSLGPDYGTYYNIYERVSNPIREMLMYHSSRNIGFTTLAFLCKLITPSYAFFVFVCNFISVSLCAYVIYKYSDSILFSTLLFVGSGIFVIYYGSGIRQMIAMSLFFYAFYSFIPKKKYLLYEIVILIACTFHEASVIGLFIPLVAMCVPMIEKKRNTFAIGGTIICVLIGFFIIRFMPKVASFFENGYSAIFHIFSYFTRASQISIMGLGMEVVFILVIILLEYLADNLKVDPIISLEITICFLMFFLYLVFMRYPIISRICDFYQIIFLIMIPRLWNTIEDKGKKLFGLCVVVLLNGFLLYSDVNYTIALLNNSYGYSFTFYSYPYTNIFNSGQISEYMRVLTDGK